MSQNFPQKKNKRVFINPHALTLVYINRERGSKQNHSEREPYNYKQKLNKAPK